ncbi:MULTISPECIES: PHP domain-containing protein [unclassified Sphingobacterium]|uniref:PHP domain-containing protein n=1 Tax=unclassified Sphingobacterium TaxID=2609468 RepID=UPI0025F61E57|nr:MULTISPECIES: PHP domain-containing protein [unclassified Sphingobacterium]
MLLNLHSNYSLRYGTMSLDDLIAGMMATGHDSAVLTDINNSSASIDFIQKGRKAGLNMLAGMELRQGDELRFIAIAKNTEGFREINEYRTQANQRELSIPSRAPEFRNVFVIYPFGSIAVSQLRDYEYIGIRPSERNLIVLEPKGNYERYVILAPVSYQPTDYKLHCQLRAIDHNILYSQLEKGQVAPKDEVFITRVKLLELYQQFPQLIANTNRLMGQCSFDMDFKKIKNKETFTGARYSDKELLLLYTRDGFTNRYQKHDKIAQERIAKELEIIENLNFSSYFLITNDICRYAKGRNFHYVGRGSGANSAVAYCLGITDVDPIELNLPFERFLNPKRQSPPDFDIDV